MSASPVVANRVVTPARIRRRVREQQLHGPAARPHRLVGPGGRPVQPLGPVVAGGPVRLRRPRPVSPQVEGVRLTDRGIALVVTLLAVITLATLSLGVVKFLSVSNAPLDPAGPPSSTLVAVDATH